MTIVKLARVLVYDNWEAKFPLAEICSLFHPTSDHILILLISGKKKQILHKHFHFEKWWLEHRELHELIRKTGLRERVLVMR